MIVFNYFGGSVGQILARSLARRFWHFTIAESFLARFLPAREKLKHFDMGENPNPQPRAHLGDFGGEIER